MIKVNSHVVIRFIISIVIINIKSLPLRLETALLDLGQRVDGQSKDLLDRFQILTFVDFVDSIIVDNSINTMIRVERQCRELTERQKDASKDSSKLGKEEVRRNQIVDWMLDKL